MSDPTKLFGQVAIRRGFLDEAALQQALDVQSKIRELGVVPKKIGEILVELGHLSGAQVDEVLREQRPADASFAIDGFELLEKLGQGTTGAVFKARQLSLDRIVALKILRPELARNAAYVDRFSKEAKIVSQISHVNIIGGIDVGESNGYRYFVMEYVDGPTLLQILDRGGALAEDRAVQIILQIARALDHAHRLQLVHRDIKPDNIMLADGGVAKLGDLGLAKARSNEEAGVTGRAIGTPNYISPEQARGEEDVDVRSDIYSLGATFFHALTGEVPFQGKTPAALMARHLHEPPRPAREVREDVSENASRIVLRAMQKRPSDRYQTPADLIADLEALVAGKPVLGIAPRFEAPHSKVRSRRARRGR